MPQPLSIFDKGVLNNSLNVILYEAAIKGDINQVKDMLAKGADCNFKSLHDYTPLHAAAKNGHLDIVKVLLDKKADVNAVTENNITPLMFAVQNKHLKVSQALLETKDICVNSKSNLGDTALTFASGGGNYEIVKLLIDYNAQVIDPLNPDTSINALFLTEDNNKTFRLDLSNLKAASKTLSPTKMEKEIIIHPFVKIADLLIDTLIKDQVDNEVIFYACAITLFQAVRNNHYEMIHFLMKKANTLNLHNESEKTIGQYAFEKSFQIRSSREKLIAFFNLLSVNSSIAFEVMPLFIFLKNYEDKIVEESSLEEFKMLEHVLSVAVRQQTIYLNNLTSQSDFVSKRDIEEAAKLQTQMAAYLSRIKLMVTGKEAVNQLNKTRLELEINKKFAHPVLFKPKIDTIIIKDDFINTAIKKIRHST